MDNRARPDDTSAINEVRLRHLTVDEALLKLDQFLNDAFMAGLYQVRVIHGKGTGALRETVHAVLKKCALVKEYHQADETGGGWGATIVTLKQ